MRTLSRLPWLAEVLDVLDRRARLLRAVVLAVVLVGLALALLAPDLLPPRPLVGGAVALAAILIGIAATVAVDAGDTTVRGPRHVRAVGGELVAVLPTDVAPASAVELAAAVLEARTDRRLVLGLTGVGRGVDVAGWADALGVAIAEHGPSVLIVDVASGATPDVGLLEVVRDEVSLGRAVTFERHIKLARLGAGRDLDEAMRAAAALPGRLPQDLEVLLVALPQVTHRDVLAVARELDAVLVTAAADLTPRVRLQAAIEAVEGVGTTAQVVLVDDRSVRRPRTDAPGVPHDRRDLPGDAQPTRGGVDEGRVGQPDDGPPPASGTAPGDTAAGEEAPRPEQVAGGPSPDMVGPDPDPTGSDRSDPDLAGSDHPSRSDQDATGPGAGRPEEGAGRPDEGADDAAGTGMGGGGTHDAASPDASGSHRPATGAGGSIPSTPRAASASELGRSPAPSVRVVRDLPASPRTPLVPPTPPLRDTSSEVETPPSSAAAPRDPEVVAGAAAARVAARVPPPADAHDDAPSDPIDPGAESLEADAEHESLEVDAELEGSEGDAALEGSEVDAELEGSDVDAEFEGSEGDAQPESSEVGSAEVETEVADPGVDPEVEAVEVEGSEANAGSGDGPDDPQELDGSVAAPRPDASFAVEDDDPAAGPPDAIGPGDAADTNEAADTEEAADADAGPVDAADMGDVAVADDDGPVDPTDEIPAVRDARAAAGDPDDDPLRTTAQLAILMDELGERDDDGAS